MAENVIIPDEMDFETPPVLPVSRTYQRTFTPEGGAVYTEFQTIEFKIPPSPACYLGKTTYLSFDVHAKYVPGAGVTGQTAYGTVNSEVIDPFLNTSVLSFEKCGALGCIDKIQVYDYSGVNLLESTDGHGQLMCLLRDLNTNLFESQYAGSFCGTSKVYSSHMWNPTGKYVSNRSRGEVVNEGTTGDSFRYPLEVANFGEDVPYLEEVYVTKSVVIPLFSFLGVLSEQMVPLHNGFTIRFTWNSNQNAFTFTNPLGTTDAVSILSTTGSGTYLNDIAQLKIPTNAVSATINSISYQTCRLVCDYYQLSPVAEQLLRSSRASDEMVIHTKSYRNSNFYLDPNATEFSLLLNGNMKSVRNLIWFTRPNYNTNKSIAFNQSTRIGPSTAYTQTVQLKPTDSVSGTTTTTTATYTAQAGDPTLAVGQYLQSSESLWVYEDTYITAISGTTITLSKAVKKQTTAQPYTIVKNDASFYQYTLSFPTKDLVGRVSTSLKRSPTSYPRLSNRCRGNINKWWLKIDHENIPSNKFIECGPNSEDVLTYYPKFYTSSSTGSTTTTSRTVTVDRSCQSLYHLFSTQDKRQAMMNSLIRLPNYAIDNSYPVAYPYDENTWSMNTSLASGESDVQRYVAFSILDPWYNGIQNVGKFACGLNLQARPYASVSTMSGTDFSNKVVRLEGQIKRDRSNDTYRTSTILDAYLEHDAFIHILPGVVTTVAF